MLDDRKPKQESKRNTSAFPLASPSDECGCGETPCPPSAGVDDNGASVSYTPCGIAMDSGRGTLVDTRLTYADRFGGWKVRWGLGRMQYAVAPGLYAVGAPAHESPVLVSANYKLSFDHLRSRLRGRDLWILVLDTRGVNVWCAAGKGTFGTDELVARLASVDMAGLVSHRKLILPQLGATGVSAHEVKHRSGFRVIFGPVRAADLPAFLDNGRRATPDMRRVGFSFRDRMVLVPLELVMAAKYWLLTTVVLLLLSGIGPDGYAFDRLRGAAPSNMFFMFGALFSGAVLVPALLPWLPGRPFAVKGAWAAVPVLIAVVWGAYSGSGVLPNWASIAAWLLIIPTVTSFLGMNFTGASTYTSLSGVLKEMRLAVPLQIGCGLVGLGLWVAGLFI